MTALDAIDARGLTVADAALCDPVSLGGDATVQQVAQAMVRTGVPAVLVGGSRAVVSEHDVLGALAIGRSPTAPAVAIAGVEAPAVEADRPLAAAAALMMRSGLRAIVVVNGFGDPIGVLTLHAAAHALCVQPDDQDWPTALRAALTDELDAG